MKVVELKEKNVCACCCFLSNNDYYHPREKSLRFIDGRVGGKTWKKA